MATSETLSGPDAPKSYQGENESAYIQTTPDGAVIFWNKQNGNWIASNGGGSGSGIGGSIADQQVAFGSGTDISGSENLKWDDGGKTLELPGISTLAFGDASEGQIIKCNDGGNSPRLDIGLPDSQGGIRIDRPDDGTSTAIYLYLQGGTVGVQVLQGSVLIGNVPLWLYPMASPPTPPQEGMTYAGTDHHLYYYNGTTWKQLDN